MCIQAAQHGNTDAAERLTALSQPAPQALSRSEHNNLTETTLVRKRTQAKQRSDARGPRQDPMNETPAQQIISTVRKNSIAHRERQNQFQNQANVDVGATEPRMAGSALPASPRMNVNVNPAGGRPPMARIPSESASMPPPQSQSQSQSQSYPNLAHAATLPPSMAGPGMAPQQQRANPNAPRYGLSDPGISPSPAPGPAPGPGPGSGPGSGSGSGPSVGGRTPQRGNSIPQLGAGAGAGGGVEGAATAPRPTKGPATFEEMGFKSTKLEEKECVVM